MDLAKSIAKSVSSKWRLVDAEDLESELLLWLFENMHYVDRYRDDPDGKPKLIASLSRYANQYCVKEQTARSGAPVDFDSRYTIEQIRRAMPLLFEELIPETHVYEHPVSGQPIGQRFSDGTAMAILLDLKQALASIPADARHILTMQYRDGFTYAQIAQLEGISRRTAIRHGNRALQLMRRQLCADV